MEGDTQLGFRSNIGISLHMLATAKSRYFQLSSLGRRINSVVACPCHSPVTDSRAKIVTLQQDCIALSIFPIDDSLEQTVKWCRLSARSLHPPAPTFPSSHWVQGGYLVLWPVLPICKVRTAQWRRPWCPKYSFATAQRIGGATNGSESVFRFRNINFVSSALHKN